MKNINRKSLRAIVFVLMVVFLSSCSFISENRLEKNREIWKSKQIANYRYNFRWVAYGPGDVAGKTITFEVRNGENVSFDCVNCETNNTEFLGRFNTMNKVFDQIKTGLDRSPHLFDADYDENYGYPIKVEAEEDVFATDNSWSFTISNFQEIK